MKSLVALAFAVTLFGSVGTAGTATAADVGLGVHIGGLGAGVHLGVNDRNRHRRHCTAWGWRHHHRDRYCRRWR